MVGPHCFYILIFIKQVLSHGVYWVVMAITITKEDGTKEPFDPEKLHFTLGKAGTPKDVRDRIIAHIERELIDGMSTRKIYRHAFNLLRKEARPAAARYSMRRAVLAFGPTGFPFETFVGEIFKVKGYRVHTDQILKGSCVEHEVDMIAERPGECIAAELKFHNSLAIKTDVQVALYVEARFEDLKAGSVKEQQFCVSRGMLVTNTKFTHQAIAYGECKKLSLIGWNYPQEGRLNDLIAETRMHPITSLTTLSNSDKARLLAERVVLCQTLLERHDLLSSLGFSSAKADAVIAEAGTLCRKQL